MYSFKGFKVVLVGLAITVASVGSASATTITSSAGSTATEHSHTTIKKKSRIVVASSSYECTSTLHKSTESHGAGVTAKGKVVGLTFSDCEDDDTHATVKAGGSMEVHGTSTTGNGTLTSSGMEISLQLTTLGITCVLTTNNTDIGTITGSNVTGGKAIIHINATIPRTGGSIFCGSSGLWEAEYEVTSPTSLEIH